MSQRLIDLNPDLKRLRDEGFSVEVRGPFLLVHEVPYVNSEGAVERGTLVSTLDWASQEALARPNDHVVHFIGGQPCHKDGRPILQIFHQDQRTALDQGLVIDRSFSSKPPEGYPDYYQKISTYADIIAGPAFSVDPANTPRLFRPAQDRGADTVFEYHDTASSRAGITALTRKLEKQRIGIVGVGGTGAYILDLIAKTPVAEIHLYDGDVFLSHNAFRAPGAASVDDLAGQQPKVDYLTSIYRRMRKGIFAHAMFLNPDNLEELDAIDFAFVAVDAGDAKRLIFEYLEARGIGYIDCGMGIEQSGDKLLGQVRLTTSLPARRDHVWQGGTISFAADEHENAYSQNIQIAELNALNAALAVIKWKKISGFYLDLEQEMHSIYAIDGNLIINAYPVRTGDESET
jgi:hypothetical protein